MCMFWSFEIDDQRTGRKTLFNKNYDYEASSFDFLSTIRIILRIVYLIKYTIHHFSGVNVVPINKPDMISTYTVEKVINISFASSSR